MKKLIGIVALGLLLSGCAPDPKNFIGMDNSWIKPLVILFIICAVIVLVFLSTINHLEKKKYSFNFFDGISFLAGPGLITAICYIVMVISGFLIISFFNYIILIIVILFGVGALVAGYLENKKK
tara:strand:+ start:204 stop:575 length:372 start_codon:yes stop_codon:yes gene_type:complete